MVRITKIERRRYRPEKLASRNFVFLAFLNSFLIFITSKAKETFHNILARDKKRPEKNRACEVVIQACVSWGVFVEVDEMKICFYLLNELLPV